MQGWTRPRSEPRLRRAGEAEAAEAALPFTRQRSREEELHTLPHSLSFIRRCAPDGTFWSGLGVAM